MRKTRVKALRKLFIAMYASACEEAKAAGEAILSPQHAWRIMKKIYLAQPHG